MTDQTVRAQMRSLALGLLKTIPGVAVYSPGDWDVMPEKLPAIQLRSGVDEKKSLGKQTQTTFSTVTVVEMLAHVSASSGPLAMTAIELLGAQIEEVLLKSIPLRAVVEDFPVMHTETSISAQGATHIGAAHIRLAIETREQFNPDITATLDEVEITADLVNVADLNGTYANPPFPDAIAPAPRTAGPDGRAEGQVTVTLNK